MKVSKAILLISVFLLFANNGISLGQEGPQPSSKPGTDDIFKRSEVTKKAHVTKKPEPAYTAAAERNGVEGIVVIRCVFASNGQVMHIHVVSGLPDGLNESAIEAASTMTNSAARSAARRASAFICNTASMVACVAP